MASAVVNWLDRWIIDPKPEYVLENYASTFCYAMTAAYIVFVTTLGPAIMRHRRPLDLKAAMLTYNIGIVITNGCVSYKLFRVVYKYWDVRCHIAQSAAYADIFQDIYYMVWIYHLSKYVDMIDTVIFVLRKKQSQVSFLHVFHHSVIIVASHIAIMTLSFGFCLIMGMAINSFVHVLTYSYYSLAALGPWMKKYLWWKRYLTIVQIAQFCIIAGFIAYMTASGCDVLTRPIAAFIAFIFCLFLLFVNYYAVHFLRRRGKEA